jgi:hypothetical protein
MTVLPIIVQAYAESPIVYEWAFRADIVNEVNSHFSIVIVKVAV